VAPIPGSRKAREGKEVEHNAVIRTCSGSFKTTRDAIGREKVERPRARVRDSTEAPALGRGVIPFLRQHKTLDGRFRDGKRAVRPINSVKHHQPTSKTVVAELPGHPAISGNEYRGKTIKPLDISVG